MALRTRYDGVGDHYLVSLISEEAGRLTFSFECSDASKSFNLKMYSKTLESTKQLKFISQDTPDTFNLSISPGPEFYKRAIKKLAFQVTRRAFNREVEERLLIAQDLLHLVYGELHSMRITQSVNFQVDYRAELKLIALGKVP